MGGPKEGRVGDAGQGTAPVPVAHQALTEDVLAAALNDEALGLGFSGHALRRLEELREGVVGEREGEVEGAAESVVQGGGGGQQEAGDAGAGEVCRGEGDLGGDAGVVDGQEPGARAAGRAGDGHRSWGGAGGPPDPRTVFALLDAPAVAVDGLPDLDPDERAGRILECHSSKLPNREEAATPTGAQSCSRILGCDEDQGTQMIPDNGSDICHFLEKHPTVWQQRMQRFPLRFQQTP